MGITIQSKRHTLSRSVQEFNLMAGLRPFEGHVLIPQTRGQQTMTIRPNPACLLLWNNMQRKNDFVIFKWLGGEKRIKYLTLENYMKFKFLCSYSSVLLDALHAFIYVLSMSFFCYSSRLEQWRPGWYSPQNLKYCQLLSTEKFCYTYPRPIMLNKKKIGYSD